MIMVCFKLLSLITTYFLHSQCLSARYIINLNQLNLSCNAFPSIFCDKLIDN